MWGWQLPKTSTGNSNRLSLWGQLTKGQIYNILKTRGGEVINLSRFVLKNFLVTPIFESSSRVCGFDNSGGKLVWVNQHLS